jgi:hypothetical protein
MILAEQPPQTTNPIERINFTYKSQGFLPKTKDETTKAYNLILAAARREGAGFNLGEIYGHEIIRINEGTTDEAVVSSRRAMRAHVYAYRDFYYNAQANHGDLVELSKFISNQDPDETALTETMMSDYFTRNNPAITNIVRFIDLQALSEQHGKEKKTAFEFNPLTADYNPETMNDKMKQHIDLFLETTLLINGWAVIDQAAEAEFSRMEFWNERLAEARPITEVHKIGNTAIFAEN